MRFGHLIGAILMLSASGCGRDCTEIGCLNSVSVEYAGVLPVAVLPLEVTTCAGETCATQIVTMGLVNPGESTIRVRGTVDLDNGRQGAIVVTFEVTSQSTGETLASASGTGHLRKTQPNGGGCPPTCYFASLDYDGTTTLVG